jgi:hypothetical protein
VLILLVLIVTSLLILLPWPVSPRVRRQEAMRPMGHADTAAALDAALLVLEASIDRGLASTRR